MGSETPYSVRFSTPTLIPKGRDTTVTVDVEYEGAAPTVTAQTFTLFDPAGTKLLDGVAATESAGTLSYTILAAVTADEDLGRGYLIRFEVTIGGAVHWFTNNAAVCLQMLYNPVGTTDLTNRYAKLAALQATGASDLQRYVTDSWSQLLVKMYSGGLAFRTIRSPGHLKQWVLTRALSYALADLSLVLGNGGPYRDEGRRLESLLKGQYEQIRSLLDVSEDNQTSTVQQSTSGVIQLSSGRGRWGG